MKIKINKCGTRAGYIQHRRDKTVICQPCRDAKSETNKQYYAANKDKVKESHKQYYIANKDKVIERSKQYYISNKDNISKHMKKWQTENPEKVRNLGRTSNRKRRALKLENWHEPYTEEQVLLTYGELCDSCGTQIDLNAARKCGANGWEQGLHIDHLIPISKGGPDTLENVRPSHGLCNILKGDKL